MFESQVARAPDAIALIDNDGILTYAELNVRANRVAHRLIAHGVQSDDRVAICMERSAGMVVGILGILKAGAGYVPIDQGYPSERIAYLLEDSAPAAILTTAALRNAEWLAATGAPILDIETAASDGVEANPDLGTVTPRSLAYVIYTSGSTGEPKGVQVEHRNILRLAVNNHYAPIGAADCVAHCSNPAFDASTWELWAPLLNGARVRVIAQDTVLDPVALNRALIDGGVTALWLTVGLFNEYLDALAPAFAGLEHLLIGGDALDPRKVAQALANPSRPKRLVNGYGPTETTTFAITHEIVSVAGNPRSIPLGTPIANTTIHLLDAQGRLAPAGVAGEIHIGGDGVARGYLNRPGLTAERFLRDPFSDARDARMYRTGDLGRWLPDGTVEFLGRNDFQVKIRGFRIELGEIEARLIACEGVRDAVVLAREDAPGDKRLVAYWIADAATAAAEVADDAPDAAALRARLQERLPDYMVPSAFVRVEAWPLTANGKLDRNALPAPDADAYASRAYAAPEGAMEDAVASIWRELLPVERIGRHDNFFELGGHSLLAVQMASRVRRTLGVELPLRVMFEAPTLSQLAARVSAAERSDLTAIPTARRSAYMPLSLAQQRLWFLTRINGASAAYHVFGAYRLHGALDRAALERALQRVVDRHESLRTRFLLVEGQPMQTIAERASLDVSFADLRGTDARALDNADARTAFFERAFDLGTEFPLRVRLLQLQDDLHELQLLMHHIASDGWSVGVLLDEVGRSYAADVDGTPDPLPPLTVQYSDYAQWQRQWLAEGQLERQSAYWRKTLADAPVLLELPADRPRPQHQSYAGGLLPVRIDATLASQLKALGQRHGATLYMTLLASWAAVLSRLSNQNDVVIGSPVAGRGRTEIEPLIGFFVNTLALRIDLQDQPTVETLLSRTRQQVLEAQAHQDLPFDQVVEAVKPARSTAHAPIFQTVFAWQNQQTTLDLRGLRVETVDADLATTEFDLTLSLEDTGEAIVGELHYATDLFDRGTAARFADCWQRLLRGMADCAETPVATLPLLDDAERRRLLVEWNATAREYPRDVCLHQLFDAQVARAPDAVALVCGDVEITYAALQVQAEHLVGRLRAHGVRVGCRVAICAERNVATVAAVLAALKAGAAYVPLDPAYPPDRLAYQLGDAQVTLLLADATGRDALRAVLDTDAAPPVLRLDDAAAASETPSAESHAAAAGETMPCADDIAYIIYTSGSTGLPKGTMVPHRCATNMAFAHRDLMTIDADSRVLQFASFAFDVCVAEIFSAFASGAALVLPMPGRSLYGDGLIPHLREFSVSHALMPPALLSALPLEEIPATLQTVVLGGEVPDSGLIDRLLASRRVINAYGPTEATVCATMHAWTSGADARVIGTPLPNVRIHILDAHRQLVPTGVIGEIHVGGAGVADGYWNRPELTAERFIRDPFADDAGARMYATGDLGRWRPDGSIEFLGRNDFQVKVRGFRIELGEIEAQLVAFPGVREAVVVARADRTGETRLVAYVLAADAFDTASLRAGLSKVLPEYMLPSAFVRLDAFPLTPNGKIDRKALPAPDTDAYASRPYEAPQGGMEDTVAGLWRQLLGIDRIGRHDNFFELGGHSLIAVTMIERMRKLGLRTDVRALFTAQTLMDFAAGLDEAPRDAQAPANLIPADARRIEPAMLPLVSMTQVQIDTAAAQIEGGAPNIQDLYPLSSLQEGMLFQRLLTETGDPYHATAILGFDDRDSVGGFVATLQQVIDRHDVLRTAFVWNGLDQPVQVVLRKAAFECEALSLDPKDGPVRQQLSSRYSPASFRMDLTRAPLFRGGFAFDPASDRWLLCVVFHHMLMDHTSLEVVVQEATLIGQGRAAELPKPAPYRNYIWQAKTNADPSAHQAFFAGMLGGIDQPTTPFGLTTMVEEVVSFDEHARALPTAMSLQLRQRARELGVGTAAIMHLAWAMVVSRATGMDRVVFGTVLFGRMDGGEDADRALGLFINSLPIRIDLDDLGIAEAIRRSQTALADLLPHEHASLATAQRCSGVPASSPLFTSLINYRYSSGPAASGEQSLIDAVESGDRTNYPLAVAVDDFGTDFEIAVQVLPSVGAARVCDYLQTALSGILAALAADAQTPVAAIEVMPAAEYERIVHAWNDTVRDFPLDRCAHELLAEQVASRPEATAVVYADERLSYGALNARANRLAHRLRASGVGPGTLVAVALVRGVDMVVTLLGVLKAGGAYVPMAPDAPADRVAFMLSDARPQLLLAHRAAQLPESIDVPVMILEDLQPELDQQPDTDPVVDGMTSAQLIYVIYTSGTTGTPKGIAVTHRNLVNFVHWCADMVAPGDPMTQFAPYTFDASAGEIFACLLAGAELHVLDDATIQNPQRLQTYLIEHRIRFAAFPPSYLQYMDPSLVSDDFQLLTAGSAPTPELVRRWAERGHYLNGYGPTETTILSTTTRLSADEETISIGRPIANTRVYLLDERRRPVPIGAAGEIWIGGEGVTPGYLHRPELTAECFLDDRFSGEPGARMYKTGDLGRWLPDGSIEFLGRNDFQVKIRGFRIELGEIESRLCAFEDVREAVVLAREDGRGEKQLVAYYLAASVHDASLLRPHLAQTMPDYMVPAAFVRMDAWPLTVNGKIDRKALPAPEDDAYARRAFEPPQTAAERALAAIWSDLLGVEQVGRHDHFFELGGHSLLAVQLVSRVRQSLDVELPLRALFEAPVLCDLAARAGSAEAAHLSAIPVVERTPYLPLSLAQQRLWFLTRIEGPSAAYHMGGAVRMTGTLDRSALERALQRIVQRHEALRTRFVVIGGQPMQSIAAEADFALSYRDLSDRDDAEAVSRALGAESFAHPFDLGIDLPLRVLLVRLRESEHCVYLVMHHIASDGWSIGVLLRELNTLYAAFLDGEPDPLPPLAIQYADYAAWQQQWLNREQSAQQIAFWKKTLAGAPTLSTLPTDRLRPSEPDSAGDILERHLDAELVQRLRALGQRHGATLYMIFLAAWAALLGRLSNQDDVVIGSPVAGRNRAEVEPLIGFFVNTLALRIDLSDDPDVAGLLDRTRHQVLEAQAHQDLPFDQVVEAVRPARSTAHTPIFQTMLTLNNQDMGNRGMSGLEISPADLDVSVSQFEISLDLTESGDDISGMLTYASGLFDRSTAERYFDYWVRLLDGMADADRTDADRTGDDCSEAAHLPVSRLPILDQDERDLVLKRWNATQCDYPHDLCMHQPFERCAMQTPDAIALLGEGPTLTYGELNARANRMAHRLIALGVEPDDRVAMCVERGSEALVCLIAILKAGGAYVPIDTNLPPDRIGYIIEDCAPKAFVATADTIATVQERLRGPVVPIRIDQDDLSTESDRNPDRAGAGLTPRNLAYVIYTSGSTGMPKGVLIEHGQAVARNQYAINAYSLTAKDRCGQFASLGFDASVMQLFSTLSVGASLLMRGPDVWSPEALVDAISRYRVTVAEVPPVYLPTLLEPSSQAKIPAMRILIVGGDATQSELLRGCDFGHAIINEYGPTETTITSTSLVVRSGADVSPLTAYLSIGRPIENTTIYILDRHLQPVPVGVSGEIHIGGLGVSRGYLNRLELTRERFVEDPFSDAPGARMYKSGDLGRWLPDGCIDYIGRNDFQVKIRGFRIELGEIEAKLCECAHVREAVVLAREDTPGEKRLVAYCLMDGPLDAIAIRTRLSDSLPAYMVPAAFVRIDEWPLNASGKIDRKALPDPQQDAFVRSSYDAPIDRTERIIASVWQALLAVDNVGRNDRFFDLGGHSMLLLRMISELSERGIGVTIQDVYRHGTVQAIAAAAATATPDPEAWLTGRAWRHASARISGERILWIAPAAESELAACRRMLARCDRELRPDRVLVVDDPHSARDSAPATLEPAVSDIEQRIAGLQTVLSERRKAIDDASIVESIAFGAMHTEMLKWGSRDNLHVVALPGWWSVDALRSAYAQLVTSQSMLRTEADVGAGQLHVLDAGAFRAEHVPCMDLRGLPAADADTAIDRTLAILRDAKAETRLAHVAAIVSRSDTDHFLALHGDHLIWDGRSFDAIGETMLELMSGSGASTPCAYRAFVEDGKASHEAGLLDRFASEFDATGLADTMRATVEALEAVSDLPLRVIAAGFPIASDGDAAEQAFSIFRRLVSSVIGLDAFGMVLTHHGRQLGERDYFGQVGLFLDMVPARVDADTTFDALLQRVHSLHRSGLRYVDWERSGDSRVSDTLPSFSNEISFNWQPAIVSELEIEAAGTDGLLDKLKSTGIICEFFVGEDRMDMVFAYRGSHEGNEGVTAIIESASGVLATPDPPTATATDSNPQDVAPHHELAVHHELAIVVDNVRKRYDQADVVKGISFTVPKGSCFGILGPNGAGKTSLLGMIEGIVPITSGRISVMGMDVETQIRKIQPKFGVQLQSSNYFPFLTVSELITFYSELRAAASGKGKLAPATQLLERLDLSDKMNFKVEELSGGQKQRLSLVLALLADPEIIFLDEPTAALDPHSRRYTWEFIEELKKDRKHTIVLTTHYMEEAERLCDEIMIMNQGEIVGQGNPSSMIAEMNATQQLRVRLGSAAAGEGFVRDLDRRYRASWDAFSDSLLITTDDVANALRETLSLAESRHVSIESIQVDRLSLEDVFLNKTGKDRKQ